MRSAPDTDAGLDRRLVEFRSLVDQLSAGAPAPSNPTSTDLTRTVPVTLITGPLGSGKTTIVRHLLTSDHGQKLAVLVNDVAAVNIDSDLLADTGADRVELTNGCSCCSLVGDATEALTALAADLPDAIVFETSGVTDPVALCQAIAVTSGCHLDGVVAAVDAEQAIELIDDPVLGPILRHQLDAATAIALTKPDLITQDELESATTRLAGLAPGRPVLPVLDGALDPAIALDGARHGARLPAADSPADSPTDAPTDTPGSNHGVVSLTVQPATTWDAASLGRWLDDPRRPSLARAKGTIQLADGSSVLLQLVGRRWRLTPGSDTAAGARELVVIGVDPQAVESAASALRQGPAPN